MTSGDLSSVLNILRSLYKRTRTLEEFADGVVFREGRRAALLQPSDTHSFKSFVRGVFVCSDEELQDVPSCNQTCTFPELLAFILNSLKRKRRRNVLAHGYNFLGVAQEDRDADHFRFQGDLSQSAAYIHSSDLWKKVTARLGTDVTRYLLGSCSVFVLAPPSCVFQICGVPAYDRVSMTTASSGFLLRPPSRKHKSFQVGKKTRSANLTKTGSVGDVEESRKRRRVESEVSTRKRKRESEEEESRERRRGVHHEERRQHEAVLDESTLSGKSGENDAAAVKPPPETSAAPPPLEGGPSWRSGAFPPLPSSQCFIRTLGFLYGGRGMHGFCLNRKRRTAAGPRRLQGQDLVRLVFFEGLPYLNGQERKPKKLPLRYFNMVPVFGRLLQRHRKCRYSSVLHRMCPVVELSRAAQGELSSLIPQHCAPHRVYLFVRECLTAVVPEELWGSDHNRLQFFSRVRGFLKSGKFERISVAELMWKIKVMDCDWLKLRRTAGRFPPSELAYRTRILSQFLTWLLDGFVVGLVRACFYATESVGQKNAIRFYRQEVWSKLQDLAFRRHIAKGEMEELSPAQVASLPKGTVISQLRFIPKTDGMRPITRVIGADSNTRLHHKRIRDLMSMLQARVRSAPALLGSTVWGMTDIHKVLRSLAPAQKDKPQPLYFVKVDVSGAYDSLPHDKLKEVITEALSPVQEEVFTVRHYAKIWADSHEGLKKAFARQVDFSDGSMGSTSMKGFVMSLQKSSKVHHAVLVEQAFGSNLRGKDALQFFTQMLTGSVVQHGKKTYRQCRGIPQGSVVSSLLCCLCYGHMENVLFRDIKNKGWLMRLVDDFLLITPDRNQAQSFLSILLAGVPQYGVVANPQKVVVNFQGSEGGGAFPDIRVLPPHCLFPWCGLLLDTRSLDVCKDYSSYAGLSLRYSLTLGSAHSAGQQMRRKLMSILRIKCHPLFLDLKTNSLESAYKNIHKLVLLQACRFHVCVQSLPFAQTVAKNPTYFQQMIWDMAHYANALIRRSNTGLVLGDGAQKGSVQYEAVELLFCLAFLRVLSKHRPVYKDLLPRLHKWKRRLERLLGDLRLARVRQAANPRALLDFLAMQM
uniref:Telomerase reverse transcriptase n=1 Tax=Oryzias latipes TaxID=8090 RepID=TERT_ORYLA|nr:RecName: Full=Telomerase reverse transcriptase; AltName: Full=Telomerase catalytic subunit [Oryzias latipes]